MAFNLKSLWDALNGILNVMNETVEDKVELAYGAVHNFLKAKAESTETEFDDNSLKVTEIGLRDKLIALYPLEQYPLDK